MRRLAVKIAYLGDGFSGSQVQPSSRTVEGEVLGNLELITKLDADELDLRFSSRTDKGVNALGNAISFHSDLEGNTLLKALNSVSDGVFYRSFCEIGEDMNIRHASGRRYRYVLPNSDRDLSLAEECADLFVGEHDFLRFCRPDGKPTTLTIDSITVSRSDDTVVLEFEARYFLWNMIRRISSAIDRVSLGKAGLDDVRRALDGEDITFGVARPDALTLVDVRYDWLTFQQCTAPVIASRRDGLVFGCDLRRDFYRSL